MTDTDAITSHDRQAVADLIHRYFWLIDHGRADETIALFASDATLTFGPGAPKPGTLQRAAIGMAMTARAQLTTATTRHVVSNIQMRLDEVGKIACSSLLTLYRSDDDSRDSYPASIADIEDVCILDSSGWKIKERLIAPIFNRSTR